MRRWTGLMLLMACMACSSPDTESEGLAEQDLVEAEYTGDDETSFEDTRISEEEGSEEDEIAVVDEITPMVAEAAAEPVKAEPQDPPATTPPAVDPDREKSWDLTKKKKQLSPRDATGKVASQIMKPAGKDRPNVMPSLNLERKNRITKNVETEMQVLLSKAMNKFADMRDSFNEKMEVLTIPPRIQAVENKLYEFYKEREDLHEAKVMAITERYEAEIAGLLDLLEPEVWRIAFQVCGTENIGSTQNPSTGITDVDGIVEATWDLIKLRSGLEELHDEGQHYKYSRLFMGRIYKNDIEGEGRFSIFASDSIPHFFSKDEDIIGVTVGYQRKGLDPSIPLEFRQLVRNRIVRGGTTRYGTSFEPDSTLDNSVGRLRIERSPVESEEFVVSTVFYPRLNRETPHYDNFHDFTAVRDYITAVVNSDTKEILDCARWQYMWHISHFGCIAIEKGIAPEYDEEAKEMKAFLKNRRR